MRNYHKDYPKNWRCEECEYSVKPSKPINMKGMIEYHYNHRNNLPINSAKWNLIRRNKIQNGKVKLLSLREVITLTLRDKKSNRILNSCINRRIICCKRKHVS